MADSQGPASSALESLRYCSGSLSVLNQLKLPHETEYVNVTGTEDAFEVITSMMVRGAPLIAIVAALGLAVETNRISEGEASTEGISNLLKQKLAYMRTSRPTAVNLDNACDALSKLITDEAARDGSTGRSVIEAYVAAAEAMVEEDVEANRRQGKYALEALLSEPSCKDKGKLSVLTHCNTGSLACAGFGTALGVIRTLSEEGMLKSCYCTETRPYNQGARLTAYEFTAEGLPGTLIPDSAAAFLLSQGKVDAIAVGADRIVANGDTANKIGTLQLAIAAKHYGVPFLVVAPLTSCDTNMSSGADIVIEERSAEELKTVAGVKIAPDGIAAWNPAFDVTPAALITAIVTDKGIVRNDQGKLAVKGFVETQKVNAADQSVGGIDRDLTAQVPAQVASAAKNVEGYEALVGGDKVAKYLANIPRVMELLGALSAEDIVSEEFGDGNLNLVFRCSGKAPGSGTVIVKQALPYVRCVGESWPLTLERAYYESEALMAANQSCPEYSPEVYHTDRAMAVIVMRYIEPPHVILRQGLIKGVRYGTLASDMGTYLARTLFLSSSLHLSGSALREAVGRWTGNRLMCELTEKVVFTDPYTLSDDNSWTSPELDAMAQDLRTDVHLRVNASRLKDKFMQSTEALIHGDLHTGSVMTMEGSTQVIDPEFAFYGPMGFDLGAFIGNLLLAFCAVPGNGQGASYGDWLLDQVANVWVTFYVGFTQLWREEALHQGESHKRVMYSDTEALEAAQARYMRRLWLDTLGFAGMKMIRRVVGIAHVQDLQGISDREKKIACEMHALRVGKSLAMVSETSPGGLVDVADVCELAKALAQAPKA